MINDSEGDSNDYAKNNRDNDINIANNNEKESVIMRTPKVLRMIS